MNVLTLVVPQPALRVHALDSAGRDAAFVVRLPILVRVHKGEVRQRKPDRKGRTVEGKQKRANRGRRIKERFSPSSSASHRAAWLMSDTCAAVITPPQPTPLPFAPSLHHSGPSLRSAFRISATQAGGV
jgi:hypothetical protein